MSGNFSVEYIAEVCHVLAVFFFKENNLNKISKPFKFLLAFFMQLEFMAVVYLK